MTNFRIENLLVMAYGLDGWDQISGVPDSFHGEMFNIQAKVDEASDEKLARLSGEQQRLEQQHMVQGLLAERFHLKAHWETKDGDIYHLVAKTAPSCEKRAAHYQATKS